MSKADDRRHLARVVALGCWACRKIWDIYDSPAEAHHVREGRRPRNDREVIPLCPTHHRAGRPSLHFHKMELLNAMGVYSEQEILDEIDEILGYH